MREIAARATGQSAAAHRWALDYMGSQVVRSHLDSSLQHYSNQELLDMFVWEMARLPVFHNTPLDGSDVERVCYDTGGLIVDDTPLDIAMLSGNLQTPCQRFVLGGPQTANVFGYGDMYTQHFGLEPPGGQQGYQAACGLYSTLRGADSCMLYNANNLRKTSIGNVAFGGATFVLNTKSLKGRMFVEAFDGGLAGLMYKELKPPVYPGLGTLDPPAFLHLLQPHEQLFNSSLPAMFGGSLARPAGGYKSIAVVMNRWWVPGTPPPTDGFFGSNPYFEVMTSGNVWLPEDLQAAILPYSGGAQSRMGKQPGEGMWGSELGAKLQEFLARANGGGVGSGELLRREGGTPGLPQVLLKRLWSCLYW